MAVTDTSPPPSRWTLRAIRATFDGFRAMTPSGVWRSLERQGVGLRSAAVQHYSPGPAYIPKSENIIKCSNDAAAKPGRVVAVFRDEMGYTRWPEPGPDWAGTAPRPGPRPIAPIAPIGPGRSSARSTP